MDPVAPDSSNEVLQHFRAWAEAHISDGKVTVLGPETNDIISFHAILFGVLELIGSLDVASLRFNVTAALWVPIWGRIPLGSTSGNLRHGVTLPVDVPWTATGSMRFYVKNFHDLWVSLDLKTVVGNWRGPYFLFRFK